MAGTHKSGRKAKSKEQHILNGNPSHLTMSKFREDEPDFDQPEVFPKPPRSIKPPRKPEFTGDKEIDQMIMQSYKDEKMKSKWAVKMWKDVGPGLFDAGLITDASISYFADYCWQYGTLQWAIEMGKTCWQAKDKENYFKKEKQARKEWKDLGSEFGLTPASISGVTAKPKPKRTTAASFLNDAKKLHAVK